MGFFLNEVLTDEDVKKVSDIAVVVWNEHYKSILKKEQIDYMTDKFQSEKAIKNQIEKDGYIYYLIYSDVPAGYMAVKIEKEKLFLSKLYILKEKRGKGLAGKSFEHLKNMLKENNLKVIYLTVNKNNLSSIEVYKKLGFEIVKEEETPIGNGFIMDDYIMEYNIEVDNV